MTSARTLLLAAVLPLLLVAPRAADAGRLRFGVSLGELHATGSTTVVATRGLFAEVRLARKLAVAAEVSRADAETAGTPTLRRLAATATYDLGAHGLATPFLLVGLGTEHAPSGYYPDSYRTAELGAGLAVRVGGQLSVTIDARVGQRAAVNPPVVYDAPAGLGSDATGYTSVRLGVGVSF